MKQWLISKIPTRVLRYLVWRNYRLREAGRLPDKWYWADIELWLRVESKGTSVFPSVLDTKNPVGIPKWMTEALEPYGDEDEKSNYSSNV